MISKLLPANEILALLGGTVAHYSQHSIIPLIPRWLIQSALHQSWPFHQCASLRLVSSAGRWGLPTFPSRDSSITQHIHNQCGTRDPINILRISQAAFSTEHQRSLQYFQSPPIILNLGSSLGLESLIRQVSWTIVIRLISYHLSCCQHIDVRNNTPLYRFEDLLVRHDVCFVACKQK